MISTNEFVPTLMVVLIIGIPMNFLCVTFGLKSTMQTGTFSTLAFCSVNEGQAGQDEYARINVDGVWCRPCVRKAPRDG